MARHRRHFSRKKRQLQLVFFLCFFLALLAVGWLIGRGIRLLTTPAAAGSEAGSLAGSADGAPYTIAVDAGHGGADIGASGVVEEYQMTAATATLLTQLLEADPNYTPVATRSGYDVTAKPSERVAEANRQGADLILSIHGNYYEDETVYGFECYPVTPGRTYHDQSMRFAAAVVEQMRAAGAKIRAENGIRYAYYDENDEKTVVDSTDDTVRTETTFTILESAACPALLVEQCFVTCPSDVDQFGDEDGCALSADCYYRAICAYFGTQAYPGES